MDFSKLDITATQNYVLIIISTFNKCNEISTIENISKRSRLHVSTVKRCIKDLRDQRILIVNKIHNKRGTCNQYVINI